MKIWNLNVTLQFSMTMDICFHSLQDFMEIFFYFFCNCCIFQNFWCKFQSCLCFCVVVVFLGVFFPENNLNWWNHKHGILRLKSSNDTHIIHFYGSSTRVWRTLSKLTKCLLWWCQWKDLPRYICLWYILITNLQHFSILFSMKVWVNACKLATYLRCIPKIVSRLTYFLTRIKSLLKIMISYC